MKKIEIDLFLVLLTNSIQLFGHCIVAISLEVDFIKIGTFTIDRTK